MAQTALSFRQRKLLKKGRPRVVGAVREPNGRISRSAKAKEGDPYGWFAPRIVKDMSKHPIDALHERGAITEDQSRAAFSWIADRQASGLPGVAPKGVNLMGVRASSEGEGQAPLARRYNEASHVLKSRCGVYGHTLAYAVCIQGESNRVIDDYFARIAHKPVIDPTPEQRRTWDHLRLAFEELERYYAAQTMKKKNAPVDKSASA